MHTNRCVPAALSIALVCVFSPLLPAQDETTTQSPEAARSPAAGINVTQPEPSILDVDPVREEINQMIRASGTAGGAEAINASPKVAEFHRLLAQMKSNETEINRLLRSMPIGFRDRQEENRREIARLRAETDELKKTIGPLALEAFRAAPNEDRTVLMAVIGSLNSSLNPGDSEDDKFNPALALEITKLLSENGINEPQVVFAGFRAAYALHDFEYAATMLERLSEMEARLNPAVAEQLAATKAKWERELELRAAEEQADDLPIVRFETSVGDFTAVLFEDHAPDTVGNFINLVEKGFYDGLSFYVVRPGMMIQSGCPLGNGKGHAGYTIACECTDEDDFRHHFAGTLSMFNGGLNTGGSRFFISQQPNTQLDGRYTVFGRIVENTDVIYEFSAINKTGVIPDPGEPAVIEQVTVIRKRNHEYVPDQIAVLAPVDPRQSQGGRIQPRPDRTVPEQGDDPRLTIPVGEPRPTTPDSNETGAPGETESGDGQAIGSGGGVFEESQAGEAPFDSGRSGNPEGSGEDS